MSVAFRPIDELADRPVGEVVTARGKELGADATVGDARALFASPSVLLVPVIDGDAYVGAVAAGELPEGADDAEPISRYATRRAPEATAATPVAEALERLEEDGGRRLVVLGPDRASYHGVLCLGRDRQRLCVDAECHAG